MVRIFHVADTHLGHQAYSRLTPDGLNQREVDFQEAFRRVIDAALESRPDLVVHAGDFFDAVRPSNRAIAFALQQARRLSAAGIPFVVVSGNHEAPRMRETGSIFRVFDGLPHVYPVYRGQYETHGLETAAGRVTVHGVPQALDQAEFSQQLARATPAGPGHHILVVHGTVAGVEGLFSRELNELTIPQNALRPDYDYIALGHFHNHRRILDNAAYADSTERTSFAEAHEEKVFLEVELGGGHPRIRPHPTGARPMRDAGVLDASGMGPRELLATAAQRLEAVTSEGASVRLLVRGIDPAALRSIDAAEIRRAARGALHVDLRFEPRGEEGSSLPLPQLATLEGEWEAFLANRPLAGFDRERVRQEALRLLADAGGRAHAT